LARTVACFANVLFGLFIATCLQKPDGHYLGKAYRVDLIQLTSLP
jgi:hypothetical protein